MVTANKQNTTFLGGKCPPCPCLRATMLGMGN